MDHGLTIGAQRRCDNCGKRYRVAREHHRYCCTKCRNEFNRFGSPFVRLRARIAEEVEAAVAEFEVRMYAVMDQPTRVRYAALYPARARQFEAAAREQQAS